MARTIKVRGVDNLTGQDVIGETGDTLIPAPTPTETDPVFVAWENARIVIASSRLNIPNSASPVNEGDLSYEAAGCGSYALYLYAGGAIHYFNQTA